MQTNLHNALTPRETRMSTHNIPLRCRCGEVRGTAIDINGSVGNRIVCYCHDCQAFARHLGRSSAILNLQGGTDIFQLPPNAVVLTNGLDKVRCLRLTSGGMHRWYTDCCQTPIGNTLTAGWPFVGLIHSFIAAGSQPDALLGPVRAHINTQHATGELTDAQKKAGNPPTMLLRLMYKMLMWKWQGRQKPSPFFTGKGIPLSEPKVLQVDQ